MGAVHLDLGIHQHRVVLVGAEERVVAAFFSTSDRLLLRVNSRDDPPQKGATHDRLNKIPIAL